MIINNTPVEDVDGILVKREDLCCPDGPHFSKIRGVYAHIKSRPESVIGVLDTFHSQAGWAVSFICRALGKRAINFYPQYKYVTEIQPQQIRAGQEGAELVPLKAGMSAVLYHIARRQLKELAPDAYLMPNALRLPESVFENAEEAVRTVDTLPHQVGTLVISISSGTVAAGVIKGLRRAGLNPVRTILHMGYSRSHDVVRGYILNISERASESIELVDEGYSYADAARGIDAPFPCNKFYDLKAWKWTLANKEALQKPILFWNIGA